MRNITDEQIEKAFENEAEKAKKYSAYARTIEAICRSKPFNIIFGIYLVFCIVFLFGSRSIIKLLARSAIVILIPIALMAVSFIIVFTANMILGIKESRLSAGWFIISAAAAFKLKKYRNDPPKAEGYLLKKIKKYDDKPVCSLYLEALFNHYLKAAELHKAEKLTEYIGRIKGLSEVSDRIIASMEFALSIEHRERSETARIFEENEEAFSENALSDARELISFLNRLGEYKFALERYDDALDVFLKRRDCMLRSNKSAPPPLKYGNDSMAAVYTDIAKCLARLGLYSEAEQYLNDAGNLSSRSDIVRICQNLTEEIKSKQ